MRLRSGPADVPPLSSFEASRGRRPSYVYAFLAFLVLNMFSGRTDGLPLPVGPDRLLFALTVLLMVLDPRARATLRGLRLRPVHLAATATVLVAIASAIAAATLTTGLGFFAMLDRLVVPYLTFALAPVVFARAADRDALLKTLAIVGTYLGLTAVFEIAGADALVFPRYILDPSVGIHFGRARGPFAQSEANGLALLAAFWSSYLLTKRYRRGFWFYGSLIATSLSAVGALLTLTRSVWLGLVLGAALVALRHRDLRRQVLLMAVLVAVATGIALFTSTSLQDRVSNRASEASPVYDRRNTNAAAVRAIEAHPLTGIGWVRFIDTSETYVRQDRDYPVTSVEIEVHNVVLARMAELGIPGGSLWLGSVLLGPGLALVRRRRRDSQPDFAVLLLGYGAAWTATVMLSPVPYPLPNTLLWLFAGVALRDYLTTSRTQLDEAGTSTVAQVDERTSGS